MRSWSRPLRGGPTATGPSGAPAGEGAARLRWIAEHQSALSHVAEDARRCDEEEPRPRDRRAPEMSEVGVERLCARDREDDGGEREERGREMSEDGISGDGDGMRIAGVEDRLDRVDRACSEVSEDDPERANGQRGLRERAAAGCLRFALRHRRQYRGSGEAGRLPRLVVRSCRRRTPAGTRCARCPRCYRLPSSRRPAWRFRRCCRRRRSPLPRDRRRGP